MTATAFLAADLDPAVLCFCAQAYPCTSLNVHSARLWVLGVLRRTFHDRCPASIDRTLQCVAELLTNALQHSASGLPDGKMTVTVFVTETTIRVAVLDAGSPGATPHVVPGITNEEAAMQSECGRGIFLVEAYADRWGESLEEVGRTVWIEVDL